ncbi:IS1182-like element ISPfl3 family transposase [Pseudomonas sp. S32]|nr:IS1182-like element ISPfl3 family transposase [Pseudomonas sp. S32]
MDLPSLVKRVDRDNRYGYSNGQQFQACEEASITMYVPSNRTSNPGGETLLERMDFTYNAEQDRYQCPAGQWLTLKQRYKGDRSSCAGCALKAQCKTAQRRYVSRQTQEEAFERMAQRTHRIQR